MDKNTAELLVKNHGHWHHKFEIFPGVITPGSYDPSFMLDMLDLPKDLTGKTILDIGASDGFFALEYAKRGAEVTAVDYRDKTVSGFSIMEQCFGKKIKHINTNLYDLTPIIGKFDYVLCLGVIYHLPDIIRALHILSKVCDGYLAIESYVEDFGDKTPLARYYEAATLANDYSNFWAPNIPCMEAMMRDVGFEVSNSFGWGDRGLVIGKKQIKETPKMKLAYGLYVD